MTVTEGGNAPSEAVLDQVIETAVIAKTTEQRVGELEEECRILRGMVESYQMMLEPLSQRLASLEDAQAQSIRLASAAQEQAAVALEVTQEVLQDVQEVAETIAEEVTPEPEAEPLETLTDTSLTVAPASELPEEPEKRGFLRPSEKKERRYL